MPSSEGGVMVADKLEPVSIVGIVGMGFSIVAIVVLLFARRKIEKRYLWPLLVIAIFAFLGFTVLSAMSTVDVVTKISSGSEDE